MVEYHARNEDFPDLAEVLEKLISATWKSANKSGYYAGIQRVLNSVLLYHLMRLAADEKATPQVRAVASLKLNDLKDWLSQQLKSAEDEILKAHYFYTISEIRLFQKDPDRVKLTVPLRTPVGAPIGMID